MGSKKALKHDVVIEVTVDGLPVLWDAAEVEAGSVRGVVIQLAAYVLTVGHDLDELSAMPRAEDGPWETVDPRKLSIFEILDVLLNGTEDEQRLLRMRIEAARASLN